MCNDHDQRCVCVCVSACVSGRFGVGCEGWCECDHGAPCHHVSGQCLCPAGWRGRRCEKGQFITCVTITSMSRMLNRICTFFRKCCSLHFRCYFNVHVYGATLGGSCAPGVQLIPHYEVCSHTACQPFVATHMFV